MCICLAEPAGRARPDLREPSTGDAEFCYPRPATRRSRRIVGSSSLAAIVGDYDLGVAAAALTAGTRGLTSGRRMIVDEHAPAAALGAGRLGGAVLDMVNRQLGYVGSAPPAGTSWEGSIG